MNARPGFTALPPRRALATLVPAAALAVALLCGAAVFTKTHAQTPTQVPAQIPKVAPITIVINQSPWFGGFSKVVEAYEKETGNKVNLDVNPFAGSAEKQRNSVRAKDGQFDILVMNSAWLAEFYHGGFLTPLNDIDAAFKPDPQVINYDDTAYWDPKTKSNNAKTGVAYGVPINGNIQVLYYRADLYQQAGLKVPRTWDELVANAAKLHNPPTVYGMAQRGARSASDISYDWMPYLHSHNGAIFKDEKAGDFTVTINSPEAKKALDVYLELAKKSGPPNPGSYGQAQVIQALVTGKAAHATPVIAAWPQMDDPTKSAVGGKINIAVLPHGAGGKTTPTLGHFIGAIPKNIPKERQVAALAFLRWFQTYDAQLKYAQAGQPPIRKDVYDAPFMKTPEYRWTRAIVDSSPNARMMYTVPEGPQIVSVLELRLNQAMIGEKTSADALNTMAAEIHTLMRGAGYKTERLPDLK
ncbi:MAG: extracellular solute-binding protein [Betaproteobacteria bacterium]|nr:extracellular solute-binding protein [Betaproteobacteria bacterium]